MKRSTGRLFTFAIALATSFSVAACGGERDPVVPAATATVSGVVKTTTGAVVAGASVAIGSATATTGANGQFVLANLPVGTATIMTSAQAFEARSESVSLTAGTNVHDVVLTQQTIFTINNVVGYLPPGKATYKAAIVFLPGLQDPTTGLPLDSRGLVRGTVAGCSIWCLAAEKSTVRSRALQLIGGDVALIGTTTLVDQSASYQTLIQALSTLGTQSLHPELATIPIFFVGHSMGGCTAYGFSRVHGARVAGFMTMKGGCHSPAPPAAATSVPGYFLIGNLDEQYRRENITAAFEQGRAAGAPWAISIDPLYHNPIADIDLLFDYAEAVLTARLPATPGGPLRAMTETAGWLGDRSNGTIATYPCYSATPSSASWLPTQETAINWQEMANGTTVVTGC